MASLLFPALAILTRGEVWAQGGTAWSEPVELSEEKWAWFPTMAVDHAGRIHAMWPCSKTEGIQTQEKDAIFYSHWENGAWSRPVDVLVSPNGGYVQRPDITLDAAGVLHVVWTDGVTLFYSRAPASEADSATAWAVPVSLSSTRYGAAAIVADESGVLHIAYPDATHGIMYIRSSDGGRTWSTAIEIWLPHRHGIGGNDVRFAVDAGGTLHAVWTQIPLPEGYPPQGVFYARSADKGQTWTMAMQVAGHDYAEGNILPIGADTIHLAWHGRVGVGGTFHRWSWNGGQTWSTSTQILEGGGLTRAPVLAADSAGTLHLAAINAQGLAYSYWQGDAWAAPLTVDKAFADYEPHYPTLIASEGNRLMLLWGSQGSGQGTGIVRYSIRQVEAPRLPSANLATSTPFHTVEAHSTIQSPATPTPAPTFGLGYMGETPNGAGSSLPLIAGMVPAALLVVTIVFVAMARTNSR